ncbi:uncharacterized protein LOC132621968 [Lycium barbarum]|uniref:uncharacterized protein LOC132621968 n=1 Tax=Lycium barbarum TaxID=112863 RepID=UPI00293E79D5|nr:uncharacterized protein LOC132621968 [Lycium barbarum]
MRQYFHNVALTFITLLLSITLFQSNARELRPAEHGLTNQNSSTSSSSTTTTNDVVPEMLSFFNGNGQRNTKPPVALPIAENLTWINGDRGEMSVHHTPKDHVKQVLLISSLVCGATGLVLLVISVFVYVVFRFRKEKTVQNGKETTTLSTSVDNVALVQK